MTSVYTQGEEIDSYQTILTTYNVKTYRVASGGEKYPDCGGLKEVK